MEEQEEKRNPIWYVISVILMLMVVTMVIPYWGLPKSTEPQRILSLEEVYSLGLINAGQIDASKPNVNSKEDFRQFIVITPEIKIIADNIVSTGCTSGDSVCHAKALFYFVRDEFDYVLDPTAYEYVKTAHESFLSKSGDCDDASVLLGTMLKSVGIPSRFVFVPGHVYIEVQLPEAPNRHKQDNGWIVLDGTCSNCGFGELAFRYRNVEKQYVTV